MYWLQFVDIKKHGDFPADLLSDNKPCYDNLANYYTSKS